MASSRCTVCGLCYPSAEMDRHDRCIHCYDKNFSGQQPPLEPPTAPGLSPRAGREALEVYISSAHQMTPRQVEAMRRMQARWAAQQEDAAC